MEKMKITLILFCALFFFTGCQENNINPDFSSEGLVLPPKPLDPPVLVPKPKLPFNVDALRASALNTFDSIEEITIYPLMTNPNGLPPNRGETQVIVSPYNNAQIAIAQPFIDKILQVNTTTLVRQEVKAFEDKVASSSLSDDEKLMLIALSSNVLVAADFIDDGGVEKIQREVSLQLNGLNSSDNSGIPGTPPPAPGTPGGGTPSPCINTKNILRGAVVGGMASSVYGAYVGATGGTIVVPFLGTAVGGVAGAVVGFATGFTSGVLIGIATDYLFECTKTKRYDLAVDCRGNDPNRMPCEIINEAALRNGGLKLTPDSNLVSQIY